MDGRSSYASDAARAPRQPRARLFGHPQLVRAHHAIAAVLRDFESLNAYARNPNQEHLPAWRAFNKAISNSGDVGIWHETYQVTAGKVEAIYGNMPLFGLAGAFAHVPVQKVGQSAAKRIGASKVDDPAVEPY